MKKNNHLPEHGYKTLLEALEAAETSSVKAKKFLQDNRLTSLEKKLILYITQIRNNDFSFLKEFLENQAFDSIPFLKGLKHLILGHVFIYKCDSLKAEEHLTSAMPYMTECQNETFVKRMVFKVHSNLFYNYVNQKRFKEMEIQFKLVEKLDKIESDAISFLIMKVCFYSMTAKYSEAEEALEDVRLIKDKFNDIQIISYYMESFDLYVKLELFEKAGLVLEQMKKHRTFRFNGMYNYSYKLLQFLTKDERIYLYKDREFNGGDDIYYMIKVISALDEGDDFAAQKNWSKLAQQSPLTYQDNFTYKGDKCLFSLALDKCLNKARSKEFTLKGNYSELERAFINCFKENNFVPVSKEKLYFAIYGKEHETKNDLAALTMLVFRINKKGEVQFKSKKGAFYLVDTKRQSA